MIVPPVETEAGMGETITATQTASYMLELFRAAEAGALSAEEVGLFFEHFHATEQGLDDRLARKLYEQVTPEEEALFRKSRVVSLIIDHLLGFNADAHDDIIEDRVKNLQKRHPLEELWTRGHVWTPYPKIRAAIRNLDITTHDVLYDLGAGYGRVPLYGALATQAMCKGIELVPARAAVATAAIERLNLDNAAMLVGNVLDQDFTDGTVFYMYAPFSEYTNEEVMKRLRGIAKEHPIRLLYRGFDTQYVGASEPWLREVPQPHPNPADYMHSALYESV